MTTRSHTPLGMNGAHKSPHTVSKDSEEFKTLLEDYKKKINDKGLKFSDSFHSQWKNYETDWNALAKGCVSLAEECFNLEFSRQYHGTDEHGHPDIPIADHLYADFYVSPKRIAEIAKKKCHGELINSDGCFPGVKDSA
jgi:hypothetical protein